MRDESTSDLERDWGTTRPHPYSTVFASGDALSANDALSADDPVAIGRYRVLRRLGAGGFGQVYLARDDDLDRPVAIKVAHPWRVARPGDVELFLAEARTLARLDHPGIVPVFDVGRIDGGSCYVVSRYIEGSDLAARIGQERPSWRESAEVVAAVAEALHYTHRRGLVHRDIKPANILLDRGGRVFVADFGLALRDEDYGAGARFAGTPAYMSPEQARGEGHRVDGRSDIFSLGAVLYELLTGRRAFRGDSQDEVVERVINDDPRPPRQIEDAIPRALERICLKALAKRASERFNTARDMAEDLRHFLRSTPDAEPTVAPVSTPIPAPPVTARESTPTPTPTPSPAPSGSDLGPVRIVPKGLRPFDAHDADFFLALLPGPRDRDGLPESLRFWKARIEATDHDRTFRVGLIYGPSGCGKSSLLAAGLLPRLAPEVLAVRIEATAEETEGRLRRGLRNAFPDLPAGTLVESLAALRRGRGLPTGRKVLLVIDQFEQWLQAGRCREEAELIAALRQCDGARVQALVLVRDDFWLAAVRFMQALEIDLVPGRNVALVDLFDLRHARKVLRAFGEAYGALPGPDGEQTREQEMFLDRAVADLAQNGKVISVRLALFAEMIKGKTWNLATLRGIGGAEGVGVAFLEETFGSARSSPKHRFHQEAARSVLGALLPEGGTDLKGRMRSEQELREVSGYAGRRGDFDDLIRILDLELRLITPTDPEDLVAEEGRNGQERERHFQLTHDYLVPALRDWLTRKRRESRRGRAALRLEERASLWGARPEDRQLPTVLEWLTIGLLTRRREWTDPQRRMMGRAGRVYWRRGLVLALVVTLAALGGFEAYGRLRASSLVESLVTAETGDVPRLVPQLEGYRRWADPLLVRLAEDAKAGPKERLHARLALSPVDASQIDVLGERMLHASPAELPVIREFLKPHRARLVSRLWAVLGGQPDLCLMSWGDGSGVPTSGKGLVIVGTDNNGKLHIRIFDDGGVRVTDTDEARLNATMAEAISKLKKRLPGLLPPHVLTDAEMAQVLDEATSIVGRTLGNTRADPDRRFRAGCALAAYDDDPERSRTQWETSARFLAARLLTSIVNDPSHYTLLVEMLKPIRDRLTDPLAATFQDRAAPESERSLATNILAEYAADAQDVLADLLMDADEKQFQILFPTITSQDPLEAELLKSLPLDAAFGARDRLARRQANAAVALVRLGRPQKLWPLLKHSADPSVRGFLVNWLKPRGVAPETLLARLKVLDREVVPPLLKGPSRMETIYFQPTTSERRALILALGGFDLKEIPDAEVKDLVDQLLKTYWDDPDAGIHGATEWLLRRWGQEAEVEKVTRGFDLRLMSWGDGSGVPTSGKGRVIVGTDKNDLLHIRIFDESGKQVKDEDETRLPPEQAQAILTLKQELPGLLPRSDLRLMSWGDGTKVPTSERHLVIIGTDKHDLLHIRIFDESGKQVKDEDETRLPPEQAQAILTLKQELPGLLPPHVLTDAEEVRVLREATSIVGHTLLPLHVLTDAEEVRVLREATSIVGHTLNRTLPTFEDRGQRRWFVNREGLTFAVIDGPVESLVGSPPNDPNRFPTETLHTVPIDQSYAISTTEVSIEQFNRFLIHVPTMSYNDVLPSQKHTRDDREPREQVTWYQAVVYCWWLSYKEGLEDPYDTNAVNDHNEGMSIPLDFQKRSGYRLPTEAEWEYACRAGTVTSRYYGESEDLLPNYAWFDRNSRYQSCPCAQLKPNDLGLFDMLGNVFEYCSDFGDAGEYNHIENLESPITVTDKSKLIMRGGWHYEHAEAMRSQIRYRSRTMDSSGAIGFRIVKKIPR
jgi:serine/threonine protein kinase/formylglycine-generating enzyme required for sulfatase activity